MAIGGTNCHHMFGISYWTEEDGKQLSLDVEKVFNSPGGKERYWEQVPLVYRKENYKVEVCECFAEDIVEIDTYRELKAIDKTYDV
jgi:CTP:phosphocholine cytidylyltransferase-like protein